MRQGSHSEEQEGLSIKRQSPALHQVGNLIRGRSPGKAHPEKADGKRSPLPQLGFVRKEAESPRTFEATSWSPPVLAAHIRIM